MLNINKIKKLKKVNVWILNTLQVDRKRGRREVSYCHSSNSRCLPVYSTTILSTLT